MGWRRSFYYYLHRVFRGGDSVHRVTAGLALGVAFSFSPFLGTHILQATFAAVLIRANWVAAIVGTVWGNPWTFPFIFWISYQTGVWCCNILGGADFVSMPDYIGMQYFSDHPLSFLSYLAAHPLKLLLPMTIGGYICALLSWPIAYAILYYPVRIAQKSYDNNKSKRLSSVEGE